MLIDKYPERVDIDSALRKGDTFLAVISFDASHAIIGHTDECMEHQILLARAGLSTVHVDRYFRISFDNDGADWTFVCPPDYREISDKSSRLTAFYEDGFAAISRFMAIMGLFVGIKIPRRYWRRIDTMA